MTSREEDSAAEREARHDLAQHADRPSPHEDVTLRYLTIAAVGEAAHDHRPSGPPPEPSNSKA